MPIQFHPDVGSIPPQKDTSSRKPQSSSKNTSDERTATTVRVQYTRTEVYNLRGKVEVSDDRSDSLLDAYLEMKQVIREQISLISGPEIFDKSEAEAGEAVVSDTVPEYWNRENTARRIFAIALMGYEEGGDREAFADRAIAMVKQAYSDVGAMLGFELPQLVTDTKEAVLSALEQFKNGTALSEISFE